MKDSLNNEKTSLYNDDQYEEYDEQFEIIFEETTKVVDLQILAEYDKPYLAGQNQLSKYEKAVLQI